MTCRHESIDREGTGGPVADRGRTILIAASGFIYRPTRSNNLGDRAQLACSIGRLREAMPGARLVAVANSLNDDGDLEGMETSYALVRYLSAPLRIARQPLALPSTVSRAIRIMVLLRNCSRAAQGREPILLSDDGRDALDELIRCDALYISGAGTFNDLYMLGVGAFWSVVAHCVKRLGKPVVASGQQIGPLRTTRARLVARWGIRAYDLLGVRDPISRACAVALGQPLSRVILTGDDAWDMEAATPDRAGEILSAQNTEGPFIAAQVRFGDAVGWHPQESKSVAAAIDSVARMLAMPVVFVPCVRGRRDDDSSAAHLVRDQMDEPAVVIDQPLNAPEAKAILGQAALAVGTANHFCVFAASAGTPVVGLYSSPYMEQKISGLARLWPGRIRAVAKHEALTPSVLRDEARALLAARELSAGTFGFDAPRDDLDSSRASRELAVMLAHTQREYSKKFASRGAADAYADELHFGRFMANLTLLERQVVRGVLSEYTAKRGNFDRQLDFACGTGRAIEFTRGFANETVGVDISDAMLTHAKLRHPDVAFRVVDVVAEPDSLLALGPFDLVTVWRFIAPAEPNLRAAALKALALATRTDGILLLNNNANASSLAAPARSLRTTLRRPRERTGGQISHAELCRLLETVGFHVEGVCGIAFLPEPLTRRLPPAAWRPVESVLQRAEVLARNSVNNVVIARRIS